MNISGIWTQLETEGATQGRYRRRVHEESCADIYLVIDKPANTRGLLVDVELAGVDLGDLASGRGIELRRVNTTSSREALELTLANRSYADLFDALVIDVAAAAAGGADERDVAARLAARVRRWQSFLRETSDGLSPERQRGLFGELFFLHRLLLGALPDLTAVESWVGPLQRPQDFVFGVAAVEVKTTAGAQPQLLRITSERQLDSSALDNLALFHLSLDAREGTGQTLPDLVGEIRRILQDPLAFDLFDERLFAGGYLDAQAPAYGTGYTVRLANIFLVAEGFPRIVESDCPAGVGDVVYSIAVGALTPFAIDASTLLPLIREACGG